MEIFHSPATILIGDRPGGRTKNGNKSRTIGNVYITFPTEKKTPLPSSDLWFLISPIFFTFWGGETTGTKYFSEQGMQDRHSG